jgi:hypothetical protein
VGGPRPSRSLATRSRARACSPRSETFRPPKHVTASAPCLRASPAGRRAARRGRRRAPDCARDAAKPPARRLAVRRRGLLGQVRLQRLHVLCHDPHLARAPASGRAVSHAGRVESRSDAPAVAGLIVASAPHLIDNVTPSYCFTCCCISTRATITRRGAAWRGAHFCPGLDRLGRLGAVDELQHARVAQRLEAPQRVPRRGKVVVRAGRGILP